MATAVSLSYQFQNLSPFSPTNGNKVLPNGFMRLQRRGCGGGGRGRRSCSLFVKRAPTVNKHGVLSFNGKSTLLGVPENVVVTPLSDSAAFLGAMSSESVSRHVFKLGVIEEARLLSLFRFKIWWMIPRVGCSAKDIPVETQMLLLEEPYSEEAENTAYVLFLPILDGEFRSSLQGNLANELELCVESGDSTIIGPGSSKAVLVNSGCNPFELIKESMKILQKYSGTFALRETKQMPGMLDWFGWCTWDAFYQDVNPQGIKDGLKSLSEGGTPAKFLIIDDGWQDTINEFQKEGEPFREGSQFGARLMSIRENEKFRKAVNDDSSSKPHSLKDFVSDIKGTFGLKYVYVWHALMGYWGGLHPDCQGSKKYNPTLKFPVQSTGNLAHRRDIAMDRMEEYGVGIVDPERIFEFYDDLHKYLVSQEVDGVKVDVQNILETVATGLGGRVSLTRSFHQSLEKSISNNFQDNSIICCMAQSTDSVYSANRSAITRASDDYYPDNPTTQTLHIAAVAYNSLFFGEVFVPDWDMFYSLHDAAEFHAVARAIGGCGVYVSDKPGKHDFEILRRLVLPDGSVLRAKYPGRPSRDCLFADPVVDGKSRNLMCHVTVLSIGDVLQPVKELIIKFKRSGYFRYSSNVGIILKKACKEGTEVLLKIWNHNKHCGVLGVFNCQGAGTWPGLENTAEHDVVELTGEISPANIEFLTDIAVHPWTGDFAVFSFKSGSLSRVPLHGKLSVKLKTLQCDIFTVSPIKSYNEDMQFAAIGLINMYNSGGAIDAIEAIDDSSCTKIRIKGRGEGIFGAYMSSEPKICYLNMEEVQFRFSSEEHFLSVIIPTGTNSWEIHIHQ